MQNVVLTSLLSSMLLFGCTSPVDSHHVNTWPPALEDSSLYGVWLQEHAPVQNQESHGLLILNADKTWSTAEVWGDLSAPERVEHIMGGGSWIVEHPDPENLIVATQLVQIQNPSGQDELRESRGVVYVDASLLVFGSHMNSIVISNKYVRASEDIASVLRGKVIRN